ncbi:MAG: hypothetical protein SH857_06825, partial [Chitinophagales bacterium]|nr:hypothetical protein [Chitinophagales bacterium]
VRQNQNMKRGAVNLTAPCFLELQMIFLSVSSVFKYYSVRGLRPEPTAEVVFHIQKQQSGR